MYGVSVVDNSPRNHRKPVDNRRSVRRSWSGFREVAEALEVANAAPRSRQGPISEPEKGTCASGTGGGVTQSRRG